MKKKSKAFPIEVLAMWHPTKNGGLKLEDFGVYSHAKAWWKCHKETDHEWEAPIAGVVISIEKQTSSKGCPFCQGLRSCPSNCLAFTHPDIAKLWHPQKNGLITPQDVTKGSNKKAWWKCPKRDDHEWRAVINNRSKANQGCPFCLGRKTSRDSNLTVKFPQIAQEWDFGKNGQLKPTDVNPKSNKKVWWKCPKGHEYDTKVCHRTRPNARCPYCVGRKLSPERSLTTCNPKLAAEFHPTKNGPLTAADVFISSGKRYWWLCNSNSTHEWRSTVDNRQRGTGCPYCAGKKTMVEDSFAHKYPNLLEEWDLDLNEKDPFSLALKSNHRVHWKCKNKQYHLWTATVASRTEGGGCPYCSGHKLHEKDSAYFQLPKNILNEFIQRFNPSVDLKATSIFLEKGVVWKCTANSEHKTWEARLKTRMQGKNSCPECEPHSTRIPYEKSVAYLYPHLIKEWHSDSIFNPTQLKAGSGRLVKWVCQFRKDHTYEMRVAQRVIGHGCPKCRNAPTLPELRLFAELSLFFVPIIHHKIGKDKIDIYLNEINVAIEWDSYYYHLNRFESDEKKTQSLLEKGIRVIRVRDNRLEKISIKNECLSVIAYPYEEVNYELFKQILKILIKWKLILETDVAQALIQTEFGNTTIFEELKINRGRHIIGQSLNETHPIVATFWHPKRNGQLESNEVMAFSHESHWWQCLECKAEWCEKVVNVTKRNNVCKHCSKQSAGPEYNLLKSYPKIAKELINADPTKITPHSGEQHKWKCSKCTYEWESRVNGRTGKGKNGCPQCAGKVLSFETSIAGVSSEAVKAWDYEKNQKNPEEVFPGTHVKYFFKCSCGTSMEKKARNFIFRNQRRCSACSRKRK